MSKFKVGDKVRFIDEDGSGDSCTVKGMIAKVTHTQHDCDGQQFIYLELESGEQINTYGYRWELVVEEEKELAFNLKTQPWFIRTGSPEKSKQAQEWLFSQGIEWNYAGREVKYFKEDFLTNVDVMGRVADYFMHGTAKDSSTEIILTPITTFDIQYIHPVKETEEQKRIKDLEKIIQDAQKALDEYKKS